MHSALTGMRRTRSVAARRPTFSGIVLASEASLSLWAAVEHKPVSFREKNAIHKFSPRTVRAIFAGYLYHSEGDWCGDYYVYDEVH